MTPRLSTAQTKRDAQPIAVAAPKSSGIRAGGVVRQTLPADLMALLQARPRSTRALYSIAEADNRLVRGNRLILHVFGDHVDHCGRHAVLLCHVVRQAEHGLVSGGGLFECSCSAALAFRAAVSGEVHIGAHGY